MRREVSNINTKRSENNRQARMKRRRRVSFIPRGRDKILTVHFISHDPD
jgi:hypothetical protein